MTPFDQVAFLQVLAPLLDECRTHLRSVLPQRAWIKGRERGQPDVVSDVDLWVESRLVKALRVEFPQCATFSEEISHDPDSLRHDLCFVIDPIDGTSEFLAGSAGYSVSVAVVSKQKVVAGVVDFPRRSLRYHAIGGRGAWANGVRLSMSSPPRMDAARIAVTPRQRTNPELQPLFAGLANDQLVDIRPMTTKLAALASNAVDAAVYMPHPKSQMWIWDYAAAGLIVEEAGGSLRALDTGERLLASLPIKHTEGWVAGTEAMTRTIRTAVLANTAER